MIEDFEALNQTISLVCVDEIHCASEWSHNFRPSFLKIMDILSLRLPELPVILGLTATATRETQTHLENIFGFGNTFRCADLTWSNLHITVTRDNDRDKYRSLITLLWSGKYKEEGKNKSILVYATYKYQTEMIAKHLKNHGFNAEAFHAGLTEVERAQT